MKKRRVKILPIIILAVAIVCALGVRVYNGHLFFFDLPDRSGWVGEGSDRRYLDRHAGAIMDQILEVDGETYYFDPDGAVYEGEITLDGYTYYFEENTGFMQTGWIERNDNRYYYEENGHKVIGREYTIGEHEFLFDADGAEFIGQTSIEGKLYFFEAFTGKLKNSEKLVDGLWYFYTDDGSRFETGWFVHNDGRTCYYDGDAGMLFGEQTIDGAPYLLNISMGGRLTGTTYFNGLVYDIGEDGIVLGKKRIPIWDGIDVSWHQGPDIDWAAVKASGVQFAIVRAGYIGSEDRPFWRQDEYFVKNVLEAQAQGISVGAYIYLYSYTEEGIAEGLDSFAAITEESRVKLDLPVFLDVEDAEYFKVGSDALGGYDYRTNLVRFGLELLREKGYDPGFYTFARWVGNEFDAERLYREGYPFWLARWFNNNEDLDPDTLSWDDDKQPSLWQYRATGIVDGIKKEVDKNYLYWSQMYK
jgi:Lyzozyme M1 (1,4-beta-N-acetylmuramidase)